MKKSTGIIIAIIAVVAIILGITKFTGNTSKAEGGELITVTDRNGEVQIPYMPENVVVLDLGSLDIMDELGIEPVALPKNSLPSYLEKYNDEKYVDLGSLKSYDLEKIAAANPDLIIIEARQYDAYEELSKIAPVLYLGNDNADFFGSVKRTAEVLGTIFGKEDLVAEKLEEINSRVEDINKSVTELNSTALFVMVNEGALSVYGEGSRYGLIYNPLGFTVADAAIDSSTHGQNISNEYIKEKNPGYLFVLDRSAVVSGQVQQTAAEILENELVKTTDAYKNGNIIYVDSEAWYVGGAGFSSANTVLDNIENGIK